MRSLVLVPASGAAWDAARSSGADALVLDLNAPTTADREQGIARFAALGSGRLAGPARFVRVRGLASGTVDGDLDVVMPHRPDAIVLPDVSSGMDVQHLAAKLAVHEAQCGLADHATRLVAVVDSPRGYFGIGSLPGASHRLAAIVFDAITFAAEAGLDPAAPAVRLARATVVIAAAAARVPALAVADAETPIAAQWTAAHTEGFAGLMLGAAADLAVAVPAIHGGRKRGPASLEVSSS
ncbi:aldolase/citrate lyase family protein [Segnochrobactrum spirostomi]|nr:aldolase/citrate lyase family protein [Segnochrobactrum spirostomi]